jgi:hypothetical protein
MPFPKIIMQANPSIHKGYEFCQLTCYIIVMPKIKEDITGGHPSTYLQMAVQESPLGKNSPYWTRYKNQLEV